jgi:NAD dependent epimerase/dehydratase family enzyme
MIAKILKRPILIPRVPAFAIKLLFGEMAEIVLEGSQISSKKIQASGFNFLFENAEDALADLLKK